MAKPIPDYIKSRYAIEDLTSSLSLLRILDERGEITQAQGAEAMGLSVGTCNLHFQKLEHVGLIRRAETVTKGRGRSTIIWELEQSKNYCLLLMFDIPFFQASLVDFKGHVVLEKREDLSDIADGASLEAKVEAFVGAALAHARNQEGQIRQVFVGMPGILDPHTQVVINAVNFPALNGMDFQALMRERHGLPCRCGSMGLALYHGDTQGLPQETRTMVLDWGLGVGAVAGVGERVISHANKDSLLSELGHVGIERGGKLCHCGRKGCLESYTGGWAMLEALGDDEIQSLESFRDAVLEGRSAALEIAGSAAYTLGKSLGWPLQVMQSDRIIISGPLSSIFPMVRDQFVDGLATTFTEEEISKFNPVASQDASFAMQHGAFRCARRAFFYPDE
jgi:predicted NBD/HSP70 family sugar kinase